MKSRYWTLTIDGSTIQIDKEIHCHLYSHRFHWNKISFASMDRLYALKHHPDVKIYRKRPYLVFGNCDF